MSKRYDLHTHSNFSDGSDTVDKLLDHALEKNLSGLSITDHDTIDAYLSAPLKAEKRNLQLLPGVEISSVHKEHSVHLLVYSFSLNDQKFKSFIREQQEMREARNLKMIEKLKKHGMPLDYKKLKEDVGVIGRPHIANALLKLGYVESVREAFDRFIKEDMPCYEPGARPSVEQVIEIAHRSNAFVVLAHPHFLKNAKLERELLSLPLDGLEVRYANFLPYIEKKWEKEADKRNLIKTGGSDYHGTFKPHIELGASWVREDSFNILWQRYQENEHLHKTD